MKKAKVKQPRVSRFPQGSEHRSGFCQACPWECSEQGQEGNEAPEPCGGCLSRLWCVMCVPDMHYPGSLSLLGLSYLQLWLGLTVLGSTCRGSLHSWGLEEQPQCPPCSCPCSCCPQTLLGCHKHCPPRDRLGWSMELSMFVAAWRAVVEGQLAACSCCCLNRFWLVHVNAQSRIRLLEQFVLKWAPPWDMLPLKNNAHLTCRWLALSCH